MANKEKRNHLPECGGRCCISLKANRRGKCKLDEATDINSVRTRLYSGLRNTSVDCACGCNEQHLSNLQSNRPTFIKFTGPTSDTSLSPAGSVIPTNSNFRSTSGCLLEKNLDGKSRAFDLENNNVSVEKPEEYFRSVTIWQGFLIKPVNVRTRRTSLVAVQQSDRSNNGLLSSEHNFCSGKSQLGERQSYKNKNSVFYHLPKVGSQISFQKVYSALFWFGGSFLI